MKLSVRSPRMAMASAALGLTVALAACGGSGHSTNLSSSNGTSPTSSAGSSGTSGTGTGAAGGGGGGGGGSFPGAFGSVAAITGQSMEVQNQQTGQVTVSWTPSTRFSQTVTVPASAVAVGSCVTVNGTSANGAIEATSVTISQPSSTGSCTGGRGGVPGRGQRPPGTFPNRTPTSGGATSGTRPAGAPAAGFGFASGKVTAVAASTLTIDGFSSANFRPRSASTPSSVPAATSVRVDLKSTTTYDTARTAAASNLAVGDCVTATGSSSSNGSVTASTIRITSTGGKSCTAGVGRFVGFGGFRGGGGGAPANGTPTNG